MISADCQYPEPAGGSDGSWKRAKARAEFGLPHERSTRVFSLRYAMGFYEFSDLSMVVDKDHPSVRIDQRESSQPISRETYSKAFNIHPRIRFGLKVVNTRRLPQKGGGG